MNPILAIAILMGAGSAAVGANAGAAAVTAGSPAIVIRAGGLLDVRTGEILEGATVVVQGGRIVSVGPPSSAEPAEGAQVLDLHELTLLPGLIDAHVHLAWGAQPPAPAAPGEKPPIPGTQEALATLRAGFTTVRNLGSTGRADLALRDAVASGLIPGPRILAAGPPLGLPGGVCDGVFAGEGAVSGVAATAARVGQLAEAGVDLIKLCAGGGVLPSLTEAGSVEYTEEVIRAIVVAAHARGLKVAAHAQGPAAILNAVRGGVDSIEHGGLLDEESARLMRDRHVWLVPTLYRLDWVLESSQAGGAAEPALAALRAAREAARTSAARAFAMGVPIACGTDATVVPHGLNARELRVYVELGMKPIDAIRTATLNAAELLGLASEIGSLEPGRQADLIGVEGNPLSEISALEKVRFVMKSGVIHRSPSSDGTGQRASPARPAIRTPDAPAPSPGASDSPE